MNDPVTGLQKRSFRSIVVAGNKTMDVLSLALLLQRLCYDVVTCHSAAEALDLAVSKKPVLVVADMIFPGMSGFDLLHLLKQDGRTSSIPVVFLVPMSDAAAERRCLDIGGAGCITRPILADQMYRVVQEVTEPRPRSNIRLDTRLPVTLNNIPIGSGEREREIELSESGMYVPMDNPYPRSRRLDIQLRVKDRTISAVGTVMHSHAGGTAKGKPGVGLKFVSIDPQDSDFIRKYIREELARDVKDALSREGSQSK